MVYHGSIRTQAILVFVELEDPSTRHVSWSNSLNSKASGGLFIPPGFKENVIFSTKGSLKGSLTKGQPYQPPR